MRRVRLPERRAARRLHPLGRRGPRHLLRERVMAIDVQRVLVVGAGTMGTGIAQVAARAGYRTEIFDVASGAAQRALDRIGESLSRAVEKGRCTSQEPEQALQHLTAA